MMKAMIFAAGIGSRLRPFTLSHPKALVPVGHTTALGRVIEGLKRAGISRMVVNTHHFASQITDYLACEHNFGIEIAVSDESDLLLDTAGGLLKAATLLGTEEPVLLHNADICTDLPYTDMMRRHYNSGADVTLLVSRRSSSRCLYFDSADRMCGWGKPRTGETRPGHLDTSALCPLAFGGIHIINPSALFPVLRTWMASSIAADPTHRGREIIPLSITDFYIDTCSALDIRAYTPEKRYRWFDVGRPDTLAGARKAFGEPPPQ